MDPKGAKTVRLDGLKSQAALVMVPIPKHIDQSGGIFQVDLGKQFS